MATATSLILQEKTILAHLYNNPEKILLVDADSFTSTPAKELFEAMEKLRSDGRDLTVRNLAVETTKNPFGLSEEKIEEVISVTQKESLDLLLTNLRETKAHYETVDLLEKSFVTESARKTPDVAVLRELHEKIGDNLDRINKSDYEIYDTNSLLDKYQQEIATRLDGRNSFYDTGCPWLNKRLSEGFPPGKMTTLFSSSGSGKSTYAEYLVEKQMNKQIPCLYVSLEMDLVSCVDRLIMMRHKISLSELIGDGSEDFESPLEGILQEERKKLGRMKYFRFVEQPNLTIADLQKIVRKVKREMNTDYLIVTVDLMTMLKDFNMSQSKASDYEHAMNKLHEISKQEHVHIFGVVQSRRPNEKVSVKTIEDLEKFRPQIEQIKNSGAIEERSRIILSSYRRKFFCEKYLPEAPELDIIDDILEVQILKQNVGHVGHFANYLFDGETAHITPYEGED